MENKTAKVLVSTRGLEITFPTAWAFIGTIIGLSMLGMIPIFIVVMVTTEITGVEPSFLSVLEFIFGRVWLWIGLAVAVALIAFDRFSNEHYIFGSDRVERQSRTGPIVTRRERYPLKWISDLQVARDKELYYVYWRWRGRKHSRRKVNWNGLTQAEAEDIAKRISDWLSAPGKQPVQENESDQGVWPLEWLVTLISSRFGVAVPLLFGLTGSLLLAQVWLLYEEIDSGSSPGFDSLQVTSGDLQSLHWVIHPDTVNRFHASVRLEAEIGFDVDDTSHTLRLAARKFESILRFDSMYLQATEWFGPDSTRFIVPEWGVTHLPIDSDWRLWSELRWAWPQVPHDVPANVLNLLVGMDRPWLYLVTQATSSRPGLQIAYPPGRPDRAMPLAWFEAERAARANLFLPVLLPLTLVSILMILLTLPSVLVQSLDRRRMARVLALAFILAVPWWANQAQKLPRLVGVDNLVGELTADLIRLHSIDRDHLWFKAIDSTTSNNGVVVEWHLERSGSYDLMTELGLIELARNRRWPDEDAARQDWQQAAAATFASFSDQELKNFAIEYERLNGQSRYRDLHYRVVVPALCTQRPRLGTGFNYERSIDRYFPCQDLL